MNEQSEKQKTTMLTNIFPLQFAPDTVFTYRIWNIDPIPETPQMRELIRGKLKYFLSRPVFLTSANGRFAYGVAAGGKTQSYRHSTDSGIEFLVQPSDQYFEINLQDLSGDEKTGYIVDSLQSAIKQHLSRNSQLFEGDYGNFFIKQPAQPYSKKQNFSRNTTNQNRPRNDGDTAQIFRGISYRLMFLQNVGLCLVIDAQTTYVGSESLAEYLPRRQTFKDLQGRQNFSRWVYDYGNLKKSVYVTRVTNRTIAEEQVKGQSLYDLLRQAHPEIQAFLKQTDLVAKIVYSQDDLNNEHKFYSAATSLLRPKYTLKSPPVRALSDISAVPPHIRFFRINDTRSYFDGVYFANQNIKLGSAVEMPNNILEAPSLVFGSSAILTPDDGSGKKWGNLKEEYLLKNGPYTVKEFINPYLIYPSGFDYGNILDNFVNKTAEICQQYGQVKFRPEHSSYLDTASADEIIKKIEGLVNTGNTGFILLALPADYEIASKVRTILKTEIKVLSKCFSAAELRKKSNIEHQFNSYILKNTLAMLVENGTRFWGINEVLTYDLHLGFDVARMKFRSIAGTTTLAGKHFTDLSFDMDMLKPKDDFVRRECIPPQVIGQRVLERLDYFYGQYRRVPSSVLMHRDGRFCDEELNSITIAFSKFQEKRQVDAIHWTAVNIEKKPSIPIRLFSKNDRKISRPTKGSYLFESSEVAYLVNVGDSLTQGTQQPIRVSLARNNTSTQVTFRQILRDIFWLSQLNWNTPTIGIKLPITIHFADEKLETYSLEEDTENADDEWTL